MPKPELPPSAVLDLLELADRAIELAEAARYREREARHAHFAALELAERAEDVRADAEAELLGAVYASAIKRDPAGLAAVAAAVAQAQAVASAFGDDQLDGDGHLDDHDELVTAVAEIAAELGL